MFYSIKKLAQTDVNQLFQQFEIANWHKPLSLFEQYYNEQVRGERLIWVAWLENNPVGYITLKWDSLYSPFAEKNIPEIMDFNVLPSYRCLGIGSSLLQIAEETAARKCSVVGLGVGLYSDYGAAQKLYIKKGYIPNGQGISYHYQTLTPGAQTCLDDDLVLWFTKTLKYTYLNIKIESERLCLMPVTMKDAKEIAEHFTPKITTYMWPATPKSVKEIQQHIQIQRKKMRQFEEIMLVIWDKTKNEFLGIAAIHKTKSNTPELGIWLKQAAHGHHYGQEAMQALKAWAENHLIYEYLKYPVDKRNTPSIKLALALGGQIGDAYIKLAENGNPLDEVEYRFKAI